MKIAAFILFLALSACGQLKSTPETPAGSGPLPSPYTMSLAQTQAGCTQLGGSMSTDQTICLLKTTATLTPGQTGRVDIDPNFANGKYIVSSGSGAEIVLNGKHVADVNARILANWGTGSLQYNVESSQASATATIYACFDRNLHSVFCNNGVIPR